MFDEIIPEGTIIYKRKNFRGGLAKEIQGTNAWCILEGKKALCSFIDGRWMKAIKSKMVPVLCGGWDEP